MSWASPTPNARRASPPSSFPLCSYPHGLLRPPLGPPPHPPYLISQAALLSRVLSLRRRGGRGGGRGGGGWGGRGWGGGGLGGGGGGVGVWGGGGGGSETGGGWGG